MAALMVAAALAFILVPLLRSRAASGEDATARRLRALDDALANGIIDANEYAAKRAALPSPSATSAAPPSRTAFIATVLVAVLLPASALFLYRLVGTPAALDPAYLAATTAATSPDSSSHNIDQAIAALAARLKEHPEDLDGWMLLGRACQNTDRFDQSLDAFRHAHELAKDNLDVTAEYAQALVVASPTRRVEGEARGLLEDVLKQDAKNQTALWLLGLGDYQDGHYDAAVARWNTLLPLIDPNSDALESVKQQIADAQARRDGKTPPPQADSTAPETTAAPTEETATPASDAPHLTVNVALDPKLASALDPNATLFVFARAASGPPMPLAIQRLKASQLPTTVTLDDSMGMTPTMKLSRFPQVVIGARISKSGDATPQSGDLQTLSAPLDVHRSEPIALMIDQTVP
jgi:cytochrome c-type biogenesis protein CcmH